jgi:ABC-2 type transport system ATP-binding protein
MASPTLGWGTLTSAPVRVHTLPGNHNQLLSRPQVEVLAATLAAYLQAPPAQAASNGHGSVSYLTGLGVIAPEAVREYVSNPASPGSRGAMAGPGEVRIEGLVKTYQTSHRKGLFKRERHLIEALNGVSLHIQPGEVFGLLGPNGAGKTTLIKCLTTLLAPSQGEAWVNGFRLGAQDNEIRASIGCMLMGDRGLYWKLTGRENLEFFGALYHLNERDRRRRAGEIIERLHLEEIADRAVETYSSGQKMKLAFGKALVNDAPLLILDEPTNTLDLPSANDLRAAVRDMNRAGKTVIYTTHIMSEAEMMCDRVAIIDRGKLLAIGTVPALKASLRRAEVIRVEGVISPLARQAVEKLPGVTGVAMVAVNGHTELKVVAGDRQALLPNLIETLVRHKTVMQRIVPEEPTLEDVFIAHTGRGLAEEAGAK